MLRRAFTLVELLVVVAIMGIMVTTAVISVTSGEGAARVKGAVRDVFAAIRHARSTALVTKQPSVVTYSTVSSDGAVFAHVEIHATKLIDTTGADEVIETVTGEIVSQPGDEDDEQPVKPVAKGSAADAAADSAAAPQGESIEEILFAPVDDNVVKGMRLKVVKGDELAEIAAPETRKSRISVFSNVDYILGSFNDARAKAAEAEAKKKEEADDKEDESASAAAKDQEPVSVVWDTNGRCDPHQVWVYPDGKTPEDGMLIRVDRFGAVKVLPGNGKEED